MATIDDEALRRLHAQLTSISDAEFEAALAEALEDVRHRAVPLIQAMLLDDLISRLEDPVEREQATGAQAARDAEVLAEPNQASAGELVYAYGVTFPSAGRTPSVSGVGGSTPSMTVHRGIGVITSRVGAEEFGAGVIDDRLEDPEWVEMNVMAHDAVLQWFARDGAVIPFRFGTVYRAEDRLVERLDQANDVLAAALESVSGFGEWIVTAMLALDEDGTIPASVAAGDLQEGDGVAYLRARKGQRDRDESLDETAVRCGQACHDRLSREAGASSLLSLLPWDQGIDPAAGRRILRGAYLVRETRLPRFMSAADELRTRFDDIGLAVRIEGPLPVYHFVPTDVQEAMRG